jgi:ATP-binding cassette, subfamily F, member 3
MLQLNNISYTFADFDLFKNINWAINPGKRFALIGKNGAGKTTLLRILNSNITDYSGKIIKPKEYTIGYLPQEELVVGRGSLLVSVLEGQKKLAEIESEILRINGLLEDENLKQSKQSELINKLGQFESEFSLLGGYGIEAEAKKILAGLGFKNEDFKRNLDEFSGGWQMRVYLAKILLQKPNLLLLDEPTNHLDFSSLEWLEDYLVSFEGSTVFVSHDRYFIKKLAQEIAEIENGILTHYAGDLKFYQNKKSLVKEQLLHKAEQIKEEREKLERFINRFRYKNTKAVQVQSRIKRLEKLEVVEIPKEERQIQFKIDLPVKSYKEVCVCSDVSFRYDAQWVIENVNFNVYRGEKIALVGDNGEGKTTLTKLMFGHLNPQMGELKIGQNVKTGYYAQHQIDSLDIGNTALKEVSLTAADSLRTKLRDILGVFQLSGDDVDKKIGVLSGGEKARVSLAKILLSPVNFLIMDEPTNHLDTNSREALEDALQNYEGTALLISHDRFFLDKLVTRVFELKDGQLKQYEGNYSDYLHYKKTHELKENSAENIEESIIKNNSGKNLKEKKKKEAELRQSISKKRKIFDKQIATMESEIEQLEAEKKTIENQLADPEIFKNESKSKNINKRYQEIQKQLPDLYINWEKAQVDLEGLLSSIKTLMV